MFPFEVPLLIVLVASRAKTLFHGASAYSFGYWSSEARPLLFLRWQRRALPLSTHAVHGIVFEHLNFLPAHSVHDKDFLSYFLRSRMALVR